MRSVDSHTSQESKRFTVKKNELNIRHFVVKSTNGQTSQASQEILKGSFPCSFWTQRLKKGTVEWKLDTGTIQFFWSSPVHACPTPRRPQQESMPTPIPEEEKYYSS